MREYIDVKPRNGISWTTLIYVIMCSVVTYVCSLPCSKTEGGDKYHFVIGILSPGSGSRSALQLQRYIAEHSLTNVKAVKDCFNTTSVVSINVDKALRLKTNGWTKVIEGMNNSIITQANHKARSGYHVIIGPFYENLAMIFEHISLPYIVTDYIGFDWIDSSLVRNNIKWKTLVELLPSASEVNRAVVDLFVSRQWSSVVVILPGDSKVNQVCQDLITQMIKRQISPIAFNIDTSGNIVNQTADVLRNTQQLAQTRILICSPRDEKHNLINTTLNEAQNFGLLEREDYVIFALDTKMYLQPLKEMRMYRKGLYATKCQLLAFRYKTHTVDTEWGNAVEGAAVDAAELIRTAQKRYLDLVEDGSDTFNALNKKKFLRALKEVSLPNGMTGNVQFNREGKRVNYTLLLYSHGGLQLYHKEAVWQPNAVDETTRMTFTESTNETEQEQMGIFKDVVKIVVVEEEPFVKLRSGHNNHADRLEGFTVDVIKELARQLNMKYELYISPENAYGTEIRRGVWNGMIQEVINGNATLGMGAISITSDREKVIDFSLGVMTTGVNMLISKPKEHSSIFQFMKPFSLELWMAIVGASFVVSVLYFILDYKDVERQFTLKETLWFSVGTLLMRGTDFSPKRTAQRIITAGFTFFVLITVSTYTANLAAFLTTTNLEQPISTLDDLAERDEMNAGTLDNSATLRFLKEGKKASYRKIWEKIIRSNGLVKNSTEGRQRAEEGNFAFIYDYRINSYYEKIHCKNKMVGTPVRLQQHGIVMKAGATFKTRINIALLRMLESGFIREKEKKWWDNKQVCNLEELGKSSVQVEFAIKHMAGVFVVGGFGLACSVSFFLFKKFYILNRSQGKNKDEDKKPEKKLLDNQENSDKRTTILQSA